MSNIYDDFKNKLGHEIILFKKKKNYLLHVSQILVISKVIECILITLPQLKIPLVK